MTPDAIEEVTRPSRLAELAVEVGKHRETLVSLPPCAVLGAHSLSGHFGFFTLALARGVVDVVVRGADRAAARARARPRALRARRARRLSARAASARRARRRGDGVRALDVAVVSADDSTATTTTTRPNQAGGDRSRAGVIGVGRARRRASAAARRSTIA